jgi:1-phosphofructokinase family hexose kinase
VNERTIATVTLNPSVDVPLAVDEVHLGETNRCTSAVLDPGGKGINASRVIRRLGGETIAFGFAGGLTGELLRKRLDEDHVAHAFDEIDGFTRIDVMVYERRFERRTRLLPQGPHVGPRHMDALRSRLSSILSGAILTMGGSVPPGLEASIYRDLVGWLDERGVRCIVDASGEALASVLVARPALIKPNEEEAAQVLGRTLNGEREFLEAAVELRERGARAVALSLGANGAVAVNESGAWRVTVPHIEPYSTIGSGDSMVGGIALAFNRGWSFQEALRFGAAAGTATAMTPQRELCRLPDVERLLSQIVVDEIASVARSA